MDTHMDTRVGLTRPAFSGPRVVDQWIACFDDFCAMTTVYECPSGHRWSVDGDEPDDPEAVVCPVCPSPSSRP